MVVALTDREGHRRCWFFNMQGNVLGLRGSDFPNQ